MKLVLCGGIYDLLHVAHVRHLEQARSMGDRLVIGLTIDEVAEQEKRRPVIPEKERREMLLALSCVSNVRLVKSSIEALKFFNPQIFCKGHDYRVKGLLDAEVKYCVEHDIEILFTKANPQTTSGIIERIRNG
jgi:cytidyltransferase-like protein